MNRDDLAARVCRWMFPNELDDHGPSELDRDSRGWGMGRAEAHRRIAHLPHRTLAAVADFTDRTTHPAIQRMAATLISSWCAGDIQDGARIDHEHGETARDLAALTVLSDVLSSVTAVTGDSRHSSETMRSLREVSAAYATDADSHLGSKRNPLRGILYADPADIEDFRGLSFAVLLLTRVAPAGPRTPEVFAYLADHIDQHERIARTAKDRGTLDPAVLSSVLDSSVPAFTEGVL